MLRNRSIPNCTVIPELPFPDIGQAIDWLFDVFGFTLRIRIGDHRAQMNVGDGAIVLTALEPGEKPIAGRAVMVRVDSVDRHFEHASRKGARILRSPPTTNNQ